MNYEQNGILYKRQWLFRGSCGWGVGFAIGGANLRLIPFNLFDKHISYNKRKKKGELSAQFYNKTKELLKHEKNQRH